MNKRNGKVRLWSDLSNFVEFSNLSTSHFNFQLHVSQPNLKIELLEKKCLRGINEIIKLCNIYCFKNGPFLINWRLSRNGNDILFRINPKSGFVIWILYKSQFSSLKNVKFKTCRLDKGSQNKFRDEILILNVILSESIFITLNCFIFSRFVWHLVFSFVYLIQSDLVQSNK